MPGLLRRSRGHAVLAAIACPAAISVSRKLPTYVVGGARRDVPRSRLAATSLRRVTAVRGLSTERLMSVGRGAACERRSLPAAACSLTAFSEAAVLGALVGRRELADRM